VFERSERFYDAIYSWKDYPGEVERLRELIEARVPKARTLLDVACGTGKHLELLRGRYDVEGVDLDAEMLRIARRRLGEDVPLHEGDMTSFNLGRTFDVVTCLFSSIGYARTDAALRAAIEGMARHVAPGGLLVVEPWFLPEQWQPRHVGAVFVDEPDLKVARINVSADVQEIMTLTFHYLVGTPEGVDHFTEDHVVGMFTHEQYLTAVRGAGLEVEHEAEGLMGRGLYIGTKSGG
jgi:SAM-dependent methyltransferase